MSNSPIISCGPINSPQQMIPTDAFSERKGKGVVSSNYPLPFFFGSLFLWPGPFSLASLFPLASILSGVIVFSQCGFRELWADREAAVSILALIAGRSIQSMSHHQRIKSVCQLAYSQVAICFVDPKQNAVIGFILNAETGFALCSFIVPAVIEFNPLASRKRLGNAFQS
ncbi:hypothetical protein CA13_72410 [Planctomycetes bacterium CA13]|uniref:Uncharacterized protein n=1 Tax=Novipirellula herctigrandis TaxID=2527986 RepID=A0A5C5YPE7_9BACT|nr:hypothetical protein CA13_72410 [Planctomycetes bacterium CA13]